MAASRSGGRAGENRGAPRLSTPSGTVTTTCEPSSDVPSAQRRRTPPAESATSVTSTPSRSISAGGHRVHQAPVAPVRHVAEVVPVVLDLVPHPAQRLALGQVGGLGLDGPVQRLARPPLRARGQAGRGHERLDPVRGGRIRAEFGGQPAGRLGEGLEVQVEDRLGLGGRQAPVLAAVETGHLRHRVRAAAGHAGLAARRRASGSRRPACGSTTRPDRPASPPGRPCAAGRRSGRGPPAPRTPPRRAPVRSRPSARRSRRPTTSTRSAVPASPPGTSTRPSSKLPAVTPGTLPCRRTATLPREARRPLRAGSATCRRAGRRCRTRCLPGRPCTATGTPQARGSSPGSSHRCQAERWRNAPPAQRRGRPTVPRPASWRPPVPGIPGQRDPAPQDRGLQDRGRGRGCRGIRHRRIEGCGRGGRRIRHRAILGCGPRRGCGRWLPWRGPGCSGAGPRRPVPSSGRLLRAMPARMATPPASCTGPAGSPKTTTPATAPTSGSRLRKAPATSADTRPCA